MEPVLAITRSEVVSDDAELLILVDENDVEIGTLDKVSAHDGAGVLHRAFSLFVFNSAGELLLQQRASNKRLWPDFWSNSCCSHPRAGETLELAVQRRCREELGFATPFRFVYKFAYAAQFGDLGSERELCSVYVGSYDGDLAINGTEIRAYRWMSRAAIDAALRDTPDEFSPWFKLEWAALTERHPAALPAAVG